VSVSSEGANGSIDGCMLNGLCSVLLICAIFFTENIDIMSAACAESIVLLCFGTADVEFPSLHSTNCTTEYPAATK